jgi:hypothetical protein
MKILMNDVGIQKLDKIKESEETE